MTLPYSYHAKPLIPYGKALANFLASGKNLPRWYSVYLFFGAHAWCESKASARYRFTLCLPDGIDPMEYRWPVRNCNILAYDTGGIDLAPQYIRKLAYTLLASGAAIVHCLLFNCSKLIIYKREHYEQ